MKNIIGDNRYNSIVNDILINEEFNKIKNIEHHGVTRFEHSLKVSYYAYKIADKINLNKNEVARSGLLHDFFLSKENRNLKEKFVSTFVHPKEAVENADKHFIISKREKNIIKSHMFPFYVSIPIYKESWLVSLVDKVIGTCEFACKFKTKLKYSTNLFLLVLIEIFK